MTQKILIVGDSFAADWSVKYKDYPGWPNLLSQHYIATNLAQAGCSEYKIWQQIYSADIASYAVIIISHTSPYRIPVETHPLHKNDKLHSNCDLIYTDIKASNRSELTCITEFYEKYFHTDYAEFVHQLIVTHELNYIHSHNTISVLRLGNLNFSHLQDRDQVMDFSNLRRNHAGLINHLSPSGNHIVFLKIQQWLQKNLSSI